MPACYITVHWQCPARCFVNIVYRKIGNLIWEILKSLMISVHRTEVNRNTVCHTKNKRKRNLHMRREVSLEEISDGRLYELNDMVKADCQDCAGCHDCCEGMGDSVVLDPMDVYRLCTNLGKTPQELVSTRLIQFDAMDGNILPHLCMSGKTNAVFS